MTSLNTVSSTLSKLWNSYLTSVNVVSCHSLTVSCNKSSPQPRFHQLVHKRFVQVFVAVHDDLEHNGCRLMAQVCSIDHVLPRVCDGGRRHRIVTSVTPVCDRVGALFSTSHCAYIPHLLHGAESILRS